SAVMAAIMSTSDSILMQAGTILSRDVYPRFINKNADQNKMIFVSRLSILLASLVGVLVAITQPPTVYALVISSFATIGNVLLVPYICSVYRKNSNKVGILSAMISGSISHIRWTSFDWQSVDWVTGR